jgi:ABC-type uncharacterized transport system substrate-binding protein
MAFCIKRREFVSLLCGATVAWPLVALAQKPDRSRRIGVLMSLGETDPEGKAQLSGFTQGLADLGWPDGPKLRMDVRWGGGDVNKIRTFAKELVAMQPDVILSQGTPVTAALQRRHARSRSYLSSSPTRSARGSLRDCPFREGISPVSSHQKQQWAARC